MSSDTMADTVHQYLDHLGITYAEIKHQPIFTVADAKSIDGLIAGQGCKSLLLTTKSHRHYFLVLVPDYARANIKLIAQLVGTPHLSFATSDELMHLLGLQPGSVSPFGLINDHNHLVKVIVDDRLVGQQLLFHPNTNCRTLSIQYNDLLKFINARHNPYQIINMSQQ